MIEIQIFLGDLKEGREYLHPSEQLEQQLRGANVGPVWDSVCDAFQRKEQQNPAKLSAVDAHSPAVHNAISEKMNCKLGKREKRGKSSYRFYAACVRRPRSQTGP